MNSHCTVLVKVNALVDKGISSLVAALSEIEGLVTLESCQGDVGERDAFVIFRYGDWSCCGSFLFGTILPLLTPDLRAAVSLKLQAYDADTASGFIELDPFAVPAITEIINQISSSVRASVLVTGDAHCEAVT